MEREHGNAEDCFAISVREHSDTRADDDRPIVGHLPQELRVLGLTSNDQAAMKECFYNKAVVIA